MPELPEIETLVRDLRRTVVGKTIVDVFAGQPKGLNMPPEDFRREVRGRIRAVERHGKSAILRLPDGSLWLHLGLGGTVRVLPAAVWPGGKFLALRFAEDAQLAVDKVFMGHAHFIPSSAPPRSDLGVDALDPALTERRLADLLHKKPKVAVKTALMDQALVAGIGNTYSDEILVRAHLHPARRSGTLSDAEFGALHRALREVLREAIGQRGEPDFEDLQGEPGHYQLAVHSAQRCGICGAEVSTVSVGGRTGYFCPDCQPAAPS